MHASAVAGMYEHAQTKRGQFYFKCNLYTVLYNVGIYNTLRSKFLPKRQKEATTRFEHQQHVAALHGRREQKQGKLYFKCNLYNVLYKIRI